MDEKALLPTLGFDGQTIAADSRMAAFAQLTPGYDVRPLPGRDRADFDVTSRAWLFADLVVHTSRITAVEIERTPAHRAADRRDTYSFALLRRGGWAGIVGGEEVQVGSGQVTVMDFAGDWHVQGTDQENVMIVVPRVALAAALPSVPALHGRTLDGVGGRLLADHMLALVEYLPEMSIQDAPVLREATMALIAGAVRPLSAEPPAPAAAGHARVRAYIEEHLTSPLLDVDRICRDLNMSRATLYRCFLGTGGIAGYIRQRRLEAAHALISGMTESAGMAEVADTYCFSSHAHFTTAFRQHFGYTPREARGSPSRLAEAAEVFDKWTALLGPGARDCES